MNPQMTPPKVDTTWRHYKGGLYAVVAIATNATNGMNGHDMVVYRSLKGGRTFVQPVWQWNELVEGQPRYEHLVELDGMRLSQA